MLTNGDHDDYEKAPLLSACDMPAARVLYITVVYAQLMLRAR